MTSFTPDKNNVQNLKKQTEERLLSCDYDASTCFERDTAIEALDATGFFINSVINFIADKHSEFTTTVRLSHMADRVTYFIIDN